jgi:hypothetical protein
MDSLAWGSWCFCDPPTVSSAPHVAHRVASSTADASGMTIHLKPIGNGRKYNLSFGFFQYRVFLETDGRCQRSCQDRKLSGWAAASKLNHRGEFVLLGIIPPNDNTLDRIGVIASCACLLHCALTPLLIAAIPLLGLSMLADERVEWSFVGISVATGFLSLVPAYLRRHKRGRPLVLFGAGLVLILIARLVLEESFHFELPMVLTGALLMITSHIVNLRLCRSCAVCTDNCQ